MKWISVKDRLPDFYKDIVYIDKYGDTRIEHFNNNAWEMEKWVRIREINYWLELPPGPPME